MTKYKRVETKHGRTMWFVDGDMKSGQEIPEDVIRLLQAPGEMEVDNEAENIPSRAEATAAPAKAVPAERECIVDGNPGTHSKYAQGITVYLCDEHYGNLTTGQIVQLMREKELIA